MSAARAEPDRLAGAVTAGILHRLVAAIRPRAATPAPAPPAAPPAAPPDAGWLDTIEHAEADAEAMRAVTLRIEAADPRAIRDGRQAESEARAALDRGDRGTHHRKLAEAGRHYRHAARAAASDRMAATVWRCRAAILEHSGGSSGRPLPVPGTPQRRPARRGARGHRSIARRSTAGASSGADPSDPGDPDPPAALADRSALPVVLIVAAAGTVAGALLARLAAAVTP